MTHIIFNTKSAALFSIAALIAAACILLLSTTPALAETASIHLNDGTTVRGEVIGLKDGNYQIRSSSLGTLDIPQSKIKLVEFGATATINNVASAPASSVNGELGAPASGASAAALANITSRLQNSPGLMSNISSLAEDPDIRAIVEDPEIQRLIQAGDFSSLMTNPKMRKLMNNSKIKDITNQLK